MIKELGKSLVSWVSSFSELPAVSPELLEKKNGGLSLRIKEGPKTVKKYVFGGSVLRAEFALRIRVSDADTKSRLYAVSVLETAGENIARTAPSLRGASPLFAGTAEYPRLVKRTDNGDDEYEAVYFIVFSEGDI